jgi:LytS/YehU family sensor histidine kinase
MVLVFQDVKLTGLGLAIMLMILTEQYHNHVGRELAENEAALAKSKVKLLAEQISPHYIYNSLQSISGLCTTDPEAAREAIETFSEYLRGNL